MELKHIFIFMKILNYTMNVVSKLIVINPATLIPILSF